jgi:CRISPR-associated protein Csm4
MDTYAVTLRPRGSYIGPITAQTLFGATCWAIDTLRLTDVADLLAGFSDWPRFVFSSTFPFIQGQTALVRFLPKPALSPVTMEQAQKLAAQRAGTDTGKNFKAEVKKLKEYIEPVKKAGYVSEELFAQICAGQWSSPALVEAWGVKVDTAGKTGGVLWLTQERKQTWGGHTGRPDTSWQIVDVQRNAVDRVAGATAEGLLFHETQTFYRREQAGLWFIVRAEAEVWPWLEAAFRYLADTGLGGKRVIGKGHFDFEPPVPYTLPDAPEADRFITLSPYLPRFTGNQIEAEPRRYTLQTIRQKAENKFPGPEQMQIYSGGLRLFSEGSIFTLPEKREVFGRLAPLGVVNGHPVYYNGLALPVLAKLGGEQ